MSSRNEGEQPQYAEDPRSQFDAFRARQADDRAQQESQTPYVFPPEYAAEPTAFFPEQTQGPEPGFGAGPRGAWRGAGRAEAGRLRSVAILVGVAALAAGIGFGVYEAVGSSGPAASATAGGTASPAPAVPAATATATALTTPSAAATPKHPGKTVSVRVVIEAVGAQSFTGRLAGTGQHVLVLVNGATRFGTAAHPFSQGQLAAGETVLIRAHHTSPDVLTATVVVGG